MHKATSLVCLTLAVLTSCSRQKPLSRDELQSKLRLAASIASETGTFLDYVGEKRATEQYAKGHIEYLSAEVARIDKELHEALSPPDAQLQFTNGCQQVDALASVLTQLRNRVGHDEFAREQDRIAGIRNALRQAASSL